MGKDTSTTKQGAAVSAEIIDPFDVDTSKLPRSIAASMDAILALARERRMAQQATAPAELPLDDGRVVESPREVSTQHVTIRKRLGEIDKGLERLEGEGYFVSYPVSPQNEFPTLLARLPIFRPSQRMRQKALLNRDNALEFSTPFGSGKRHGPPLTTRDEDTLIAVTRLRSKRLYGPPHQLPIPLTDSASLRNENVGVHCVVCSVDQINKELGLTDGGLKDY